VYSFDDYVSTVVPWLREIGITDYIQSLRKDEIRIVIAIPRSKDESELYIIIDIIESLL
jgi:hypothetical protein